MRERAAFWYLRVAGPALWFPLQTSLVFSCLSMSMVSMETCRFDTGCWRPLCPYGHSGRGRAARWAALWSLLAKQEVEDDFEVVVSVPPVVAVVKITPAKHILERMQIVDVPVPLDQPGDPACRIPADTVHRQDCCRRACCDAATGSVTVAHTDDQARRDSADTVHRQGFCRAYYETTTSPSASNCAEDGRSPCRRSSSAILWTSL